MPHCRKRYGATKPVQAIASFVASARSIGRCAAAIAHFHDVEAPGVLYNDVCGRGVLCRDRVARGKHSAVAAVTGPDDRRFRKFPYFSFQQLAVFRSRGSPREHLRRVSWRRARPREGVKALLTPRFKAVRAAALSFDDRRACHRANRPFHPCASIGKPGIARGRQSAASPAARSSRTTPHRLSSIAWLTEDAASQTPRLPPSRGQRGAETRSRPASTSIRGLMKLLQIRKSRSDTAGRIDLPDALA